MGDTDRQQRDAGHCADGHPRARRSAEAFEAFVVRARDWADLALRIGECPECSTALCRPLAADGGQR